MARYSDSDDDYRSKKRSKRRSRSRSSSLDSYSRRKHKKKKSKAKKSVRSRSNSSERSYKSSRSKTSRRSRSRDRRSRSRDRSRDRLRRSRSRERYSKSRRSRSPSAPKSRYRRSRSRSNRRSRSRSTSRSKRSRSRTRRSRSRSRNRRSRSLDRRSPNSSTRDWDPTNEIPGFSDMSASEQAEKRLQLAIKAAARADEKIKEISGSPGDSLTFDEQHRRAKALAAIDKDDFMQAEFVSSRDQKLNTAEDFGHDDAMFGSGPRPTLAKKEVTVSKHADSILHPNFFISAEEKMPRWIQKLTNMRKKKLEGELF